MEQMQYRYDAAQRANRRVRVAVFIATLIILVGVGYWVLAPVVTLTSALTPRTLTSLDPEVAEAERIRLKELLLPEERALIEDFETQIKWVYDYLEVFTDFDAYRRRHWDHHRHLGVDGDTKDAYPSVISGWGLPALLFR